MYKALEVGYCMGLESLNENLPEIKAELVFTQKQLQVHHLAVSSYRHLVAACAVLPGCLIGSGVVSVCFVTSSGHPGRSCGPTITGR